eukprot:401373-Prymnesium_polylepis.3
MRPPPDSAAAPSCPGPPPCTLHSSAEAFAGARGHPHPRPPSAGGQVPALLLRSAPSPAGLSTARRWRAAALAVWRH